MDALVALFHDEMRTTMPPAPTWVAGRAANEAFYRFMFGKIAPGYFRHVRVAVNGRPGLAFYRPDAPGAPHTLHAIQHLEAKEGKLVTCDHFMLPELFALFGVPRELNSR